MSRLYFIKSDENCTSIEGVRDYMHDHDLKELTVVEAEREVGADCFYCKKYAEVSGKGYGYCGVSCPDYNPRNGKSGICVHNKPVYIESDRTKTINLKIRTITNNH